jgi:hypothetical protein
MSLKLVLVGPRGTVFKDGHARTELLTQLATFIRRMHARGVRVGLWSRHYPVTYRQPTGNVLLEHYLSQASGVDVPFFQAAAGDLPDRQRSGAVDPILQREGVARHEVFLVGNEESDMRAGVTNKLLLICPGWYPSELQYGFSVDSIAELAQFCEVFGLRQHPTYWSIDAGSLHMRAMGPYSTIKPEFANFGADARDAAKQGGGEPRFWFLMVVSSLYFSGLMHEVDYICAFPGHNPAVSGSADRGRDAVMTVLGKCFNKTYYPDLILRHAASKKSQPIKAAQRTFLNHLNTLRLNRYPRIYDGTPRKTAISLRRKRVLVVDDICTSGHSLDVARAYIEAAGGTAILFSWLKTVNTGFMHMFAPPAVRPFEANNVEAEPASTEFWYAQHIIGPDAPAEIDARLSAYKAWTWP